MENTCDHTTHPESAKSCDSFWLVKKAQYFQGENSTQYQAAYERHLKCLREEVAAIDDYEYTIEEIFQSLST